MKHLATQDIGKHKSKAIPFTLFSIGIILIAIPVYFSVNNPSENVNTVHTPGLNVTVTPGTISVPAFLSGFAHVEITVQSNSSFSHVSIYVIKTGGVLQENLFKYNLTTYSVAFVQVPHQLYGGNGTIKIVVQGVGSVSVPIKWNGSAEGILLEALLYLGICCAVLSMVFTGPWKKGPLMLLPAFIALSIFFGQRYDDFFMISSGLRVISGVNPYIPSDSLLPGLQWAYPPLYLLWSAFIGRIYLALPSVLPIASSSLNYPGTLFGNPFGAWKALAGANLFLLYGLIKLPFVISFVWIFYIIKAMSGKEQWNLWLFNPLVISVAVIWGQLDVLAVAFMLQAILFERDGKTWYAVLFSSIGAGIKVFPALIIPYIIIRSRNRIRDISALLPVLAVTLLVYQFTGGIFTSVYSLLFARSIPTFGGIFVSNGLSWQVILTYLGISSFPSLFIWVFIPVYAISTWLCYWKKLSLTEYSIIVLLIFFLTYNFVNPQYLLWVIPLFLLSRREGFAVITTAIGSIYMVLTYSFTYFLNPLISWNYQSSVLGQIENIKVLVLGAPLMRVALAIAATVVFLYMLYRISGEHSRKKADLS